ncbi:hypothetical protein J6590_027633 [Homalodisca vitripennis]|nr:hypothetical protein J6590_027633 [Homalodisca vitripennis]
MERIARKWSGRDLLNHSARASQLVEYVTPLSKTTLYGSETCVIEAKRHCQFNTGASISNKGLLVKSECGVDPVLSETRR